MRWCCACPTNRGPGRGGRQPEEAGVNIDSLHIVSRGAGHAMIALKTDNRSEAIAAIGSENIS